jgi:hypothetical protein
MLNALPDGEVVDLSIDLRRLAIKILDPGGTDVESQR